MDEYLEYVETNKEKLEADLKKVVPTMLQTFQQQILHDYLLNMNRGN